MMISIPIFILAIIIGIICLWVGFRIKGNQAVFGRVLSTNRQTWARFWLTAGYGPMGLFAAKFWPDQEVDMVDVNERALDLAKRNAQFNRIDNVNIYQSDIYEQVDKKYGLIITNPPIRAGKKIVDQILADAKDHLVENGVLLVVIQKKQGAPSAKKLMTKIYGNCEILARDKGYYILMSTNN